MSQLGVRMRPLIMAVALVLGLSLTFAGCGGGGGGGGGGATPVASPTPAQTVSVLASLQANLQNVQTDSSFQSSQGSTLVYGVTQSSTGKTLTGDLHVTVNGALFQSEGVSTYQVKSGDVVRVTDISNNDFVEYTHP